MPRPDRLPVIAVPPELVEAARAELPDATLPELVRRGLALVAGVDPDDERYRGRRPGRPRKHPRPEGEAACA
jgi:hypothetical protein